MKKYPIIRYETPVGIYEIFEDLTIEHDSKEMFHGRNIPECKKVISDHLEKQRKDQLKQLDNRRNEVANMSSNIEAFKSNPNF